MKVIHRHKFTKSVNNIQYEKAHCLAVCRNCCNFEGVNEWKLPLVRHKNIIIMKKAYIGAAIVAILVAVVGLYGCADGNHRKAERLVNTVGRYYFDTDSIKMVKGIVDEDSEIGGTMREIVADSSATVRGYVYALTMPKSELSEYIVFNPDNDFYSAVVDCIACIEGFETRESFIGDMVSVIESKPVDIQAKFVTTVSTPEIIAASLEPGDEDLSKEIIKIYTASADTTLLQRYENSLQ